MGALRRRARDVHGDHRRRTAQHQPAGYCRGVPRRSRRRRLAAFHLRAGHGLALSSLRPALRSVGPQADTQRGFSYLYPDRAHGRLLSKHRPGDFLSRPAGGRQRAHDGEYLCHRDRAVFAGRARPRDGNIRRDDLGARIRHRPGAGRTHHLHDGLALRVLRELWSRRRGISWDAHHPARRESAGGGRARQGAVRSCRHRHVRAEPHDTVIGAHRRAERIVEYFRRSLRAGAGGILARRFYLVGRARAPSFARSRAFSHSLVCRRQHRATRKLRNRQHESVDHAVFSPARPGARYAARGTFYGDRISRPRRALAVFRLALGPHRRAASHVVRARAHGNLFFKFALFGSRRIHG